MSDGLTDRDATIAAAHRALETLAEMRGFSNTDLVELGKTLIIRGEAANRKSQGWRSLDLEGEVVRTPQAAP